MSSNGVLPPPQLQQEHQRTKVTKWTCDICQVAAFDTFEEANEHEKHCRGLMGAPAQATHGRVASAVNTCIPANNTNTNSSLYPHHQQQQQQQYYGGQPSGYQPQHFFYPQPPPHQQEGGSSQFFHNSSTQKSSPQLQPNELQVPPQEAEQQKNTNHRTFKTIWTCDVCKVAEFDSFEKAVEHEKTCKGVPPSSYQAQNSILPPAQQQQVPLATQEQSQHHKQQESSKKNNHKSGGRNLHHGRDNQQKNQNSDKKTQVHDESKQQATKKRCFVCDICRVAYFQTYEEAFEHEKTCKGVSPGTNVPTGPGASTSPPLQYQHTKLPPQDPQAAVSKSGDERQSGDNSTSYPSCNTNTSKDHRGKKSPSRNTDKMKSSNHKRKEQQTNSSSSDPIFRNKDSSNISGKIRNSDTETDRCKNISNTISISSSSSNLASQSQQVSSLKRKRSEEKSSGDEEAIKGKNIPDINDDATKKKKKTDTSWSDSSASNSTQTKTKKETFNKGSESVNRDPNVKKKVLLDSQCSSRDELTKLSEQQEQSYHTVLSPLLRNGTDSPDYFKLSSFHASLMSSIELFEEDTTFPCQKNGKEEKKETSYVGFRCMYCKEKLLPSVEQPSFWTIDLVTSELCSIFYDHLSSSCEDVPVKKMQRLEAFVPHQKSGKITFSAFIKKFCTENGILNVECDNPEGSIPSHMKLLKPPNKWDGAHYCRRRAEVLAFAKSNTFPMTGLHHDTAFPQLESSLSIFNQTALEQVCFMIPNTQPDRQKTHKSLHRVAIQCKHCGNFTYLSSLTSWYKVMYTMTYSHLIKTCQGIPKDVRLKLITQQGKKKQLGNGKTTGLKQYCNLLVRYYKFEDMEAPSGVGVRVIPSKKQSEDNVKKRKLIESQEQANSNTEPVHENKKPKLLTSLDSISSQSTTKGIMIEGENGCSAFLTPSNGIPLISSLTATMASELNAHNKLLVNHFELCEEGEPLPSGSSPISLRCQDCNFCPSKSFTRGLTTVNDFFKVLEKCGKHLETCKSISESIRKEAKRTKSRNSIGCISLKEYCDFITDVYGLTDTSKGESGGQHVVTWSQSSKYMLSEYDATPGVLVKCKKENIQNGDWTPKKNQSTGTDRPRIVLSDYHYFILDQIELVNIPNSSDKTFDDVKIGVRCKHCASTKSMSSIENFVCNRLHQFHDHLKCCPEVSKDFIQSMDDLKSKEAEQRTCIDSVSTVEEATLVVLEDIFQLENSKQGVILNSKNVGAWNLIQKLGSSQENFNLKTSEMSLLSVSKVSFPILLKEVMIPISKL